MSPVTVTNESSSVYFCDDDGPITKNKEKGRLQDLRVLVVEDEPDAISFISKILRSQAAIVTTAVKRCSSAADD